MRTVVGHWHSWFHNEDVVVCMFSKEKKQMVIEKAEVSSINTSLCLFQKAVSLD